MSKNEQIYGIVIQNKDDIKQDQDKIRVTLADLDQRIHANAVQCLIHAEIHGDTSLMRRLLLDSIGELTGYRRQGLINWMRKHSPMELTKDNVNLSGTDKDGVRRPFLVEKANQTPFWLDSDNKEMVVKPVFRDALTGKIESAIREFENALANTTMVEGKAAPVDPSKGFYDGIHVDKVAEFFESLKMNVASFKSTVKDDTRTDRIAQASLRRSLGVVDKEQARKIVEEVLEAA